MRIEGARAEVHQRVGGDERGRYGWAAYAVAAILQQHQQCQQRQRPTSVVIQPVAAHADPHRRDRWTGGGLEDRRPPSQRRLCLFLPKFLGVPKYFVGASGLLLADQILSQDIVLDTDADSIGLF